MEQEKIYRELPLRPLDGLERFVGLRERQKELIVANKRYNEAAAKVHILLDKEREQTEAGIEDNELMLELMLAYDKEEGTFCTLVECERRYAWDWHLAKDWQLRHATEDNPAMTGGEK